MEGLGLNFKLLLAQIINFALFFFIFKKFIARPFLHFIKQAKEREREKEKILNDLKKKEEEMKDEERRFKTKMKRDLETSLKKIKEEIAETRSQLLSKAKKEAEDLLVRAKQQIEDERSKMNQEIKNKLIDLSVGLVNSTLKDYLTDEAKKAITENIVKNLPKSTLKV